MHCFGNVDAYFVACYSLSDVQNFGLFCSLSVLVLPCDLSDFLDGVYSLLCFH